MPRAADGDRLLQERALPAAFLHHQRTFCECAAFFKREKVLLWRKKKAKPEKETPSIPMLRGKNQKIPYFFFTNLRIKELPTARNLGGNHNEEIRRGQANAGTRHVNDRIKTPCSTLVGQGVFYFVISDLFLFDYHLGLLIVHSKLNSAA